MTLDWSVVWTHRDALVDATGTTILLAAATMAIALPCGAFIAALRLYAWSPIRTIAVCYVEFFRNLPLILVVYWAFYVLPILTGLGLSPFLTGLAALALQVTAYHAAKLPPRLQFLPPRPGRAALAPCLGPPPAIRRAVVPPSVRRL